ncbi:Os01g0731600 [Oryza sativa Japonica Group]|uniref:Os01g0731600 protein n=1 Tax=Oryza sativa subsp. japonica TaxID=39947 RepID=A0A0P0V7U9_ORYSJ|nr:Os01g0731600 [Oryza sativa Japonica Group]
MAAADSSGGDKYRSHLAGDGEKNTVWRHGAPPTFDTVNSLFESERTQEWPAGSLEETVQNAIKTWEMELSHKARLQDFKSVSPGLFRLSVNGGRPLTGEETLAVGSYNALLASPILPGAGAYDAAAETFESSHDLFRAAFPRGFAWEVIRVYSGPPVITFKFRHWGHMDGPYKGHAPTGDKVEFYGVAVLKVHTHACTQIFTTYDQITTATYVRPCRWMSSCGRRTWRCTTTQASYWGTFSRGPCWCRPWRRTPRVSSGRGSARWLPCRRRARTRRRNLAPFSPPESGRCDRVDREIATWSNRNKMCPHLRRARCAQPPEFRGLSPS